MANTEAVITAKTIAKASSDDLGLTAVVMFSATGLLVSLLLVIAFGLDLSPGYF